MNTSFFSFIKQHTAALLASAVACLFIYYYTRHSGIGISPDSVMYLSTANNIRSHFSFTDFNGLPTVDFPLGYPVFLALCSWISSFGVLQIAPVINALLFSGIILLSSCILNGYRPYNSTYKVFFLAALACSPCLLEVYSMLWSETLFIFYILLFTVAWRRYFQTHNDTHLFIAGIIAALAFVTRYAGITLLATGGFLLLFDGELSVGKKIKQILLFFITGASLTVINLYRNHLAAGHATGVREKALRSLTDNIYQIGTTLADWLPFLKGHENTAAFLFIMLLMSAVAGLGYRLLQQQYYPSFETIITCFFAVYSVFILAIATISRFENLSSRLLSPMYIPLLLTGTHWMVRVIKSGSAIKRKLCLTAVLLLYAGLMYHQYRLNAEAWEGIQDAGIPGYTENPWMHSATMAHIRKNKAAFTGPVYANANDAVFFLSDVHALALPHKEIKEEIDGLLKKTSFYLIWLTDGDNPDLLSLDFIKQHKKLISEESFEDGAVYFFSDSGSPVKKP